MGQALVAKEASVSKNTTTMAKKAPKAAPKPAGKSVKGWGGGEAVYNLGKWYGPDRALFLPGGLIDREEIPVYLNGELAGDYGYDPLGLGTDEDQVDSYRAYELLHARWAMLGVAGCVIPEACESLGNGGQITGAVWWQTGEIMLDGGLLKYFGAENPLPLVVIVAVEVALMAGIESYRSKNELDLDPLYPGGKYFDPLGLADDPDAFAELKVKEIKNGRLAMMAMLGFAVQAGVTKEGPFTNWAGHVSNPFGYNILTVVGNAERVPTL